MQSFVKPSALLTFIILTPFNERLFDAIHFAPSNTAIVLCIVVTNALIIADNVHLYKICKSVMRLFEVLVEVLSFSSEISDSEIESKIKL